MPSNEIQNKKTRGLYGQVDFKRKIHFQFMPNMQARPNIYMLTRSAQGEGRGSQNKKNNNQYFIEIITRFV